MEVKEHQIGRFMRGRGQETKRWHRGPPQQLGLPGLLASPHQRDKRPLVLANGRRRQCRPSMRSTFQIRATTLVAKCGFQPQAKRSGSGIPVDWCKSVSCDKDTPRHIRQTCRFWGNTIRQPCVLKTMTNANRHPQTETPTLQVLFITLQHPKKIVRNLSFFLWKVHVTNP